MQFDNGRMELTKGEVFVNAIVPVKVCTESASIDATAGAMVSVKSCQGTSYIRACSGGGTVLVQVDGRQFKLNAGEELVVSKHSQDVSEVRPADGVTRRQSQSEKLSYHFVTLSEFAIISMLSSSNSLASLVHSNEGAQRHILSRLLKTAASVDAVTKYRGAYSRASE